jgi:Acetyltransferases
MVDRSIKMVSIEMINPMEKAFDAPALPDGYRFKTYEGEADVQGWADVMCDVTFFETREKAAEYFRNEFLSSDEKIAFAKERCFFIVNSADEYVGTCSAWHDGTHPKLHWLGVKGAMQGKGLGRAMIAQVMYCFAQNGTPAVWLDTQTTSHKAIGLYLLSGFAPLTLPRNETDRTKLPSAEFTEAKAILGGVMMQRFYEMFISSARV